MEWEKSKIIPVQAWRGALAFWGLALHKDYNWSTYEWLLAKVQKAANPSTPELFAEAVSNDLNAELSKMSFETPSDAGIGIHFSAYEYMDGYWIPELYLISNWADTSYSALRPDGVGVTRESFHTVSGEAPKPEHRDKEYRLIVHSRIQSGVILTYNNGDPALFNVSAGAVLGMFEQLARRGTLKEPRDWQTYVNIARRPIEIVSHVQQDFSRPGTRLVGGKLHDLAITPGGEYFSTSGDC